MNLLLSGNASLHFARVRPMLPKVGVKALCGALYPAKPHLLLKAFPTSFRPHVTSLTETHGVWIVLRPFSS